MITPKRVVMPEPFKCHTDEVELPALKAGEVLVETEASAISAGTELAVYTGVHQWLKDPTRTWPRFPFVPGYSAVGRITAVGPDVKSYAIGDRIIYGGRHESHAILKVRESGELQLIHKINEGTPAKIMSFVGLARFPFTALVQSKEILGQCVAVMGQGTIGQLAIRMFAAAGAYPVISVDTVASRRERAEEMVGAIGVDPTSPTLKDELRAINGGALPDIVVEATGNPQAVKTAMNIVESGGKVVMVGSPRGIAGDVDFYWDLHGRSIQLIGAHGSAIGVEPREKFSFVRDRAMRTLIHFFESGKVKIDDLITHYVHANDAKAMYDGLLNQKEDFLGVALHW
jgi:2-desacetyl-2-hydroxyethyl bacteriochlorophyllide A dehydrogenase